MTTELSPYEQWMVRSNLQTIRETNVTAAEQVAVLIANGYARIAEAVRCATTEAAMVPIAISTVNRELLDQLGKLMRERHPDVWPGTPTYNAIIGYAVDFTLEVDAHS